MIYFYSGTPGSGKSLHVAIDIFRKLRFKKNVIATFPINISMVSNKGKRKIGNFVYKDVSELTVQFLFDYAREHHVIGKEGQTLVVIDECQILFNPREFGKKDRLQWITFFTQHRKLGYNFILISQFDRLVDRQIRCLFEYEIKHRKVNNFGIGMFFPFPTFVATTVWYGLREKIGSEFFVYRRKYGKLYDTCTYFDNSIKNLNCNENVDNESAVSGEVGDGGSPPAAGLPQTS